MPVAIIEFETDRLYLRQWLPSDRAFFAEINADPDVMTYFPSTLSATESAAMAERCHALIMQRGWGFWATQLKSTGQFIGFVGLHIPALTLPISPCVEIGWRLASAHWGQGLATEAARGALQVGFELLGLTEIVAFTSMGNFRSRRVMAKLGMTDTGETFEHPALPVESPLRRHCVYRLKHESWRLGPRKGSFKLVNNST